MADQGDYTMKDITISGVHQGINDANIFIYDTNSVKYNLLAKEDYSTTSLRTSFHLSVSQNNLDADRMDQSFTDAAKRYAKETVEYQKLETFADVDAALRRSNVGAKLVNDNRSTDSFISADCLWFDIDNDEGDRKKFDLWEDESLFWTIEKFTEYFKDYEFLIRTSRRHRIDKVKSFTDAQFESYRVQTLEKDLDYFRRKCDKLEDQLADQSKRHDTIVLGMTNTISDQKLELTEGQHTFNTRIAEFEQELASTKSDLEAVRNRGFWARLFNR